MIETHKNSAINYNNLRTGYRLHVKCKKYEQTAILLAIFLRLICKAVAVQTLKAKISQGKRKFGLDRIGYRIDGGEEM